jgi:hypothetical protein
MKSCPFLWLRLMCFYSFFVQKLFCVFGKRLFSRTVYFVAVLLDQPFSLTHCQSMYRQFYKKYSGNSSGINTTTTLVGVLHKHTNWFLCDGSEGEEEVAGHLLVAFLLPVPEVFLHVDLNKQKYLLRLSK